MKKLAVILNKKALNAAALHPYLEALQQNRWQYQLYETEPSELNDVIDQCRHQYSILLIGGGDGTVRTAAQHCAGTRTILGILPLGTRNHFIKEAELPTSPEELIKALKKKKFMAVDLGEVNQLLFVNNASIGFYPTFARERNYYNKFYNKWVSYIPGLVQAFKNHKSFSFTMKSKYIDLAASTSFLMISNNLYTYEFPLQFKRESFTKALLGIYFLELEKINFSHLVQYFFNKQQNFIIQNSKYPIQVEINQHQQVIISLDGENMTTENPLIFRSHPRSLRLLTHKP